MADIKIISLEKKYINDVVKVHVNAFPDFFLTFLGPKFLTEFYASFCTDDAGIGFVALENNKVLGAVVGPLIPDGYFKRLLKRRWWAFCLASISAVLKKPSTIKRLFRAVFYRGESPENGPKRSLLSSIAVAPDTQGKGVGKALVDAWVAETKKRGSQGCFLTTDTDNNEAVNGFYQKLGWEIEATYQTAEGRNMNRYIYDFTDENS
ncbi:MAG: GNAT family N-acetyltransferase [Phycisphaerae bacterium]|nr:GNAT family N-acetyltransferase [Phycisphaerae bacterium]